MTDIRHSTVSEQTTYLKALRLEISCALAGYTCATDDNTCSTLIEQLRAVCRAGFADEPDILEQGGFRASDIIAYIRSLEAYRAAF